MLLVALVATNYWSVARSVSQNTSGKWSRWGYNHSNRYTILLIELLAVLVSQFCFGCQRKIRGISRENQQPRDALHRRHGPSGG